MEPGRGGGGIKQRRETQNQEKLEIKNNGITY